MVKARQQGPLVGLMLQPSTITSIGMRCRIDQVPDRDIGERAVASHCTIAAAIGDYP